MEGKEVIQNIRTAIGQVQTSGKEFVNIPSLYSYLDELEKAFPTSVQTAEFQHQIQSRMVQGSTTIESGDV